jgi:hypothetical protein
LLLDLVAMLITDVHAKWTAGLPAGAARAPSCQRRAIFFSSLQGCTAPATPFPPLQTISITTSPINCFAPVEYWQNPPNIRSAGQYLSIDRPAVDWNLVVLKIALRQSQHKF